MSNNEAEAGQSKEMEKQELLAKTSLAVEIAVRQSRGTAIVNINESGVTQAEIAHRLSADYFIVTVGDIVNKKINFYELPKDIKGILVTGYSDAVIKNEENEKRLQSFVRAAAFERGSNAGRFSVVVLSDTLPDTEFMRATLPWFNGPFDGADSVWSIKKAEGDVSLIRHNRKEEIIREPKLRKAIFWIEKSTTRI